MGAAWMWAAWPEWWGDRYEALLEAARRLRDEGHHEAAIATAQTACEVCTETTLSALFRIKGLTHLTDPVDSLVPSYNLANDRVRKLYEAVSGDPIHEEPFWSAFKQHSKRRNEIVHGGREAEPWESEASIDAVSAVAPTCWAVGGKRDPPPDTLFTELRLRSIPRNTLTRRFGVTWRGTA